jgi:Zn-dependent membrane protease YugP
MTMLSYFLFDPLLGNPVYLIATVLGFAISLWAQARVKSNFKRFSKVGVRSGMSGAEAAAAVWSPDVYDGRSISSIAVAAHEAGHSIQHATGYGPLGWRSVFVPVANIGGSLWYFVFIIGMVLQSSASVLGPLLMQVGIALFALLVFFQLLTLPVEFDASSRAKKVLASTGIVSNADEAAGVEKVLDAAAMTYVAAAAASIMQLIALLMRSRD